MKRLLLLLLALLLMSAQAQADDAMVLASGAGYKKMVNALVGAYKAETGQTVDLIYGNMGQVTGQANTSGKVDLVLGAEFFLNGETLNMAASHELGLGRLVVAWPKGHSYASFQDMADPAVKRIALPDTQKAIYGKAALEYLKSTGLYEQLKDKLVEVATIPQVFSYLATDEVDLGFMNLTHAMNVKDKLGGYVKAEEGMYEPIRIVVCEIKDAPHPEALADFVRFLATDKAKEIIRANGL